MTQRKLTAPELTAINTVYRQAGFIRDLIAVRVSSDFFCHLANMHDNQTSDGKPFIRPTPPIPDGWRKAVDGDEGRRDCKIWKGGGYVDRWESKALTGESPFVEGNFYIVPLDRVPTAADIGKRVKVRGWDTCDWSFRDSVFVGFTAKREFVVQMPDGTLGVWRYAIIDKEAGE